MGTGKTRKDLKKTVLNPGGGGGAYGGQPVL